MEKNHYTKEEIEAGLPNEDEGLRQDEYKRWYGRYEVPEIKLNKKEKILIAVNVIMLIVALLVL